MKKSFTLSELKFANELCYPEDFRRLIEKHTKGTYYETCWQPFDASFRTTHKNDLINFIFSYGRRDFEGGLDQIFCGIINELID